MTHEDALPEIDPAAVSAFIARWRDADGTELANAQTFTRELCELLALPLPEPSRADTQDNAYVFERRVMFSHGDGSTSEGRIDCYRRGAFVLEAKRLQAGAHTRGFDDALLRARTQAERYARALPVAEGRPPFVVVVDVGRVIELYAEFSRSGATYTPYPDPRSHRIRLDDLAKPEIRARLRAVWLDPAALDPARISGKVTRDVAVRLASVAKSLEADGHDAEAVAGFLTRCLFSMFAEDVGLLPARSFSTLLDDLSRNTQQFVPLLAALWREMDVGGFSAVLRDTLPRFNGKLFKQPEVLPLKREQIVLLREAARADWRQVEPAIFGTLLERALDPDERHALGAHYTPRSYVERLVLPTVIEPLRMQWANVQAAALTLAREGKVDAARAEISRFHHQLCNIRVLDPACGSGNFLYVTLEHLKRLEGEVLNQAGELGASMALETEGLSVDPHQFLGLEINPRAAAIAELVLWIGYLQWHFRTRGAGLPPQPVLRDFRNIECRDAVLACDRIEFATDPAGVPLTRWDGHTFKPHPATGEPVPDDNARVPLERHINPRRADWPAADYVVGNPPFIGAGPMRAALGDGYVDALRHVWHDVPDSADFVMFWWHHAADLTRAGALQRFGFITTNSLKQTFNRRVVDAQLKAAPPLSLAFAIPDHPWVDSANGAAVRIAMTVGRAGAGSGRLLTVVAETPTRDDEVAVTLADKAGVLHADLTIGADLVAARALKSNGGLSSPGFKLHGAGFIVTPDQAASLSVDGDTGLKALIKPYRNGRDLTDRPRGVLIIDAFGLTADELRARFPAVYQWLLERVKPERDAKGNTKDGAGYAKYWWLFGKPRQELRKFLVGLPRYIATVETAKHRAFQFLDASVAPDNMLVCIALDDATALGVLSSRVHTAWALAAGSRLGVGNDPRYNKTRCFEPFPFPDLSSDLRLRIAALAEQIDAHRKRQQAAHADVTLTGMYNVLEKLRRDEPLNAKEKTLHQHGLVAVLDQLHRELDAAVLDAYGWSDLAPALVGAPGALTPLTDKPEALAQAEAELLERLVALNAARAAEEAQGLVRWLRPDFQTAGSASRVQTEIEGADTEAPAAPPVPVARQPWPAELPQQIAAVAGVLAASAAPLDLAALAGHFTGKGAWKKRLPQLLDTLAALGRARCDDQRWRST
ncbi:hypothetical protein NMQ14_03375 [Methyloversatilis sp. XJ19-13]|uniref:class I SAM-dependent DNA methyltransferase n=1 Tax=Methyloversatilis sp. XJ19-13 TaxID=2963430 RepID=UPI00211BC926|nr:DNA methyltransferase [Methyloversatilis sp. XJ19-13]MCQ9373286.1 hypothetical protein [Methyloversatilis sp. XJ19-13]